MEPLYTAIGQSLLVGLILIVPSYFFTKYFFELDKKRRWDKIHKKVSLELNEHFSSILGDIVLLCNFDTMAFSLVPDFEGYVKDIFEKRNKKVLKQLKFVSQNKDLKIAEHCKESLLKGNYGTLFKAREEYLNQFQIKYLDYLEPDIIIKLMDMQKAFNFIDMQIILRNRAQKNETMQLVWGRTDEHAIKIIERRLQIIVDSLQYIADKGDLYYKEDRL